MTNFSFIHAVWRKSSQSENTSSGTCVEIAVFTGVVGVRDSKTRDSGALIFAADEWAEFMHGVKEGKFDL
ncbi:MAG: DUF397 domain-containing protein [Pseudonocardiaceae bacterium]